MINAIIDGSVRNRVFVLIVMFLTVVAGIWSLKNTPIDAIPDLSDVQVIVFTEYPGQAPQVVEDQVTYPLSTAILAVPYAKDVRGYSFFGFSMVYVIFEDGTDLYWARSRVLEYLNFVSNRLPDGVNPSLGPDATGVGWIFQYLLTDFTPRTEVLREKMDRNRDHTVDEQELIGPAEGDLYTTAQLTELFTVEEPPTSDPPAKFLSDSLKFIVECFDRDGDQRINRVELSRAANFRGVDLAELRSIQDWYLRYDLMGVDGVSEVASLGGFVKQYQVEVDPEKLRAFGVTLQQVKKAVQRANLDVGGRLIEMAETEYMVRGQGYIQSVRDLETIPIKVDPGSHAPVMLNQVANIHLGPEARRGIADMNGEGEVVVGIVLLRFGENALTVIDGVKARIEELKPGLPEGVEVHVSYDRSGLIHRAVSTLSFKLIEEMVVVALICVVFLLHFRSALVAVFTVPVGVLMAFTVMYLLGINANIMSLGGIAIAIGVMVDASVVMVENMHKQRERFPDLGQEELVLTASKQVGSALFFSLLIVTVSFLPVFTLEQQEGRLFGPLAYTKTFAMGFSAILAITVIPVLMFYFVRGNIRTEAENPISQFFIARYKPIIYGVLKHPWLVLMLGLVLALGTAYPMSKLGSEFMPPLNEGDLLYMPTTPPGISITEARLLLQQTDRIIIQHPQVKHVLGKIGRADTATDPAPLTMIETTIILTEQATWPDGMSIEDIADDLNKMVQFPGVTNAWTMPIKTRIDMLATGIKTPVGIKLLGDDLEVLAKVGEEIEGVIAGIEGTASVFSERVVGGNFIDIRIRREHAARYGLNVADVQEVISSAIGGM
ncbi:MAG: CusA/CzcA family heavy metal efflux RND transporter, partial [Rhodobacterales bacterium]|nr:CusA/CzcA family heavy metal efflux RND transporter [Rhodobacterales bacterium]